MNVSDNPMSTQVGTEPFFFETPDGARLFGVWRQPPGSSAQKNDAEHTVWVICPPFAEEEKSSHRTLVEICEVLRMRGDISLFFAYRGTADSSGDFASATLGYWRDDIRAACAEALRRRPQARLCLLGLRLGASLAVQVADEVRASRLILIEPILNGRQYLGSIGQRKRLRAMMTNAAGSNDQTTGQKPDVPARATQSTAEDEDFDGWRVTSALRDELNALALLRQPPSYKARSLVLQVGPRPQVAPPLERFAQAIKAPAQAVVMQPFWNLLDYARADALLSTLKDW
jgi:alpha/beta superfamily hydrolase